MCLENFSKVYLSVLRVFRVFYVVQVKTRFVSSRLVSKKICFAKVLFVSRANKLVYRKNSTNLTNVAKSGGRVAKTVIGFSPSQVNWVTFSTLLLYIFCDKYNFALVRDTQTKSVTKIVWVEYFSVVVLRLIVCFKSRRHISCPKHSLREECKKNRFVRTRFANTAKKFVSWKFVSWAVLKTSFLCN